MHEVMSLRAAVLMHCRVRSGQWNSTAVMARDWCAVPERMAHAAQQLVDRGDLHQARVAGQLYVGIGVEGIAPPTAATPSPMANTTTQGLPQ